MGPVICWLLTVRSLKVSQSCRIVCELAGWGGGVAQCLCALGWVVKCSRLEWEEVRVESVRALFRLCARILQMSKSCLHIQFTALCACVCAYVHIRSTGADCFDVISPALMNTLICLATSLGWRGEENATKSVVAVWLQAGAQFDLCTYAHIYMLCLCIEHVCFLLCRVQPANQKEDRHFIKSYSIRQLEWGRY